MNQKYFKILFSFLLFLLAIGTYGQKDSTRLKRLSDRKLTKNIIANYFEYDNLSFKIDAKVVTIKKTYNLNIIYRNVKDSAIWINVNHNTGIPVARFLITPDSTKILNRIDNKYLAMSNKQIVNKFNYDITFDIIQSIFTAQLLNLDPEKEILQTYSHYKVYIDSCAYLMQNIKKKKMHRLVKKDKIDEYYIHQIRINPDFKILSTSLDNNLKRQKIFVEYSKYDKEKKYPKRMDITLSNKNDDTHINMKIKKAKFNKKNLGLSFKIPKKYERITLE